MTTKPVQRVRRVCQSLHRILPSWRFWAVLLLLALPAAIPAQSTYTPYTFTTLAGLAGTSGSADGTGSDARFNLPIGVAVDESNNVYVADTYNHTIRKISPAGVVTTLAGQAGSRGSADGWDYYAQFACPTGVAVDGAGNVYVADSDNHTIRKITPSGLVTTLAGLAGSHGSTDGTGCDARFYKPACLALGGAGNLYVTDWQNSTIRKITPAGVVTTLAGLAGSPGSADGTGGDARFNGPGGVAVDVFGNLYVADISNDTIRSISPEGMVRTLAGTAGYPGSTDGICFYARFSSPKGVTVAAPGNLYVVDGYNSTIRKSGVGGMVTTLAGLAASVGTTDGVASDARFNYPFGIAIDGSGNLYVADSGNHTIRKGRRAGEFLAPEICRPPRPQAVFPGSNVVFSVAVSGTAPFSYQWRFNSLDLLGATSSSLFLPNVQLPDGGEYSVVVTNIAGSVTSTIATLTIIVLPAISQQPTNFTASAGTALGFYLTADGTAPLTCQWWFDGTELPGETNTSLTINDAQVADAGDYQVVVANAYGAVTSRVATLTVTPSAPVFTSQPRSRGVALGQSMALAANVRGTEPLTYQWLKNGTNVPGATNSTLPFAGFRAEDVGTYRLVASNPVGTTASGDAALDVTPVFAWGDDRWGQIEVPLGLTNVANVSGSYSLSLALTGEGRLGWGYAYPSIANRSNLVAISAGLRHNLALTSEGQVLAWGDNSSGALNIPISLTNVVAVAAGSSYSLALTADGRVVGWGYNGYGQTNIPSTLSNAVAIAAGNTHCLALTADGRVVGWGDSFYGQSQVPADLSNVVALAAGGVHSLALTAQGRVVGWGANYFSSQLNVPEGLSNVVAIAAGGVHSLALTCDRRVVGWGDNYEGQAATPGALSNVVAIAAGWSHSLAVTGDSPAAGVPIITGQPLSKTAAAGETATFRVWAAGLPPLRYQWRKNGTNLSGQTNTTLALANLQTSQAGNYSVMITSARGSVTSSVAVLTVPKAPATVTLANLSQPSDGIPRRVTATTTPPGLAVDLTYNGLPDAPANPGSYMVVGTINDPNYHGAATNTLVISLQLTAPRLNTSNRFEFTFITASNEDYTVETSVDLKNWASVTSVKGWGGPVTILDPNTATARQRFFRIMQVP